MLRFLRVTHLAVIDSVEVEFDVGLNVLTGETGAGKSILVEAVGLLLGGRASGDLVRTGEEVASIEAIASTGVPQPPSGTRLAFAPPRPNPSSGDVLFGWSVPADLAEGPSRLVLHDLAGRVVRTWDVGAGAASARNMTWDGRDAMGGESPPGLYVARLVVGDRVLTRLVVRTR